MAALGEEAVAFSNDVSGNGEAEGIRLAREGAMPSDGGARLGQVTVGRRRRARWSGTETQAGRGAAVVGTAGPGRAGDAASSTVRRVDMEMRGMATLVSVGVYVMWTLVLMVVIGWKKGWWMRSWAGCVDGGGECGDWNYGGGDFVEVD